MKCAMFLLAVLELFMLAVINSLAPPPRTSYERKYKYAPVKLFSTPTGIVEEREKAKSIFSDSGALSADKLKVQILQLAAALDRGQSYNPTSGEYYKDRMDITRRKIEQLISVGSKLPQSLTEISGEWELVFSSVPNGIFRSSPFFLAIQEAYALGGEPEKAQLFFRLHELQTCSWGASKVGRVAQFVDAEKNILFSEFDTSIFSLTVIPILGWFKLLPTFGGCVVTAAKVTSIGKNDDKMEMEVEYTTAKPVEGLDGLGEAIWDVKIPVGSIWQLLPWNKGRKATCYVKHVYLDVDFRIVQDSDGEYFVYSRPVAARPYSACI